MVDDKDAKQTRNTMKEFLIKILQWVLKKMAQMTVWRYRPGIVGVTGSVGKTSTKLAIASVLGMTRSVRSAGGNLNNELGLPLAILGSWSKIGRFFFWPRVFIGGIFRLIFKVGYPETLVLEYAADRPGDLKYLLRIARPDISVITAIGDIPVHVEFFSGPEDVAREKGRLIETLSAGGYAVMNFDDETVMDLKERTRARIITFGFTRGADVQITNFDNREEEGRPVGISFKLEYGGSFVPVRIDGVFGKAQAYASAAAACVGLIFGMNLVNISEALKTYIPAPSRMQLLPGVRYSYVINDSYNASPLSMHAALDTLKSLPGKRKIAVLGDMLEIGKYTLEAHERVGRMAAKFVDILVTVGPRAKFIAEAAKTAGLAKKKIYIFDTVEDSQGKIADLVKKGDLVLIKGSHAVHLEKTVEELKAF